ncbi:MAG: NirD/YgiW/YdeI family stress tolerance protein [Spirochaetes bacterium]|nr:NirD/YgiW/YdeI family stress tolerance protein [Spirochaetota bacterium]
MKKIAKLLGIAVAASVIGLSITGCATAIEASGPVAAAQEGFTGPQQGFIGAAGGSYYQAATVSQLQTLQRDGQRRAEVVITGNIVNEIRDGRYFTFRDDTGEVVVRINRRYWGGMSVGPNDLVQIYGRAERRSDGTIRVEARIIRMA